MRVRNGSVWGWLLIVIPALLFAVMMMMGRDVHYSPRASEIVSSLRKLKTAMLVMYADYVDSVDQYGRIDGQTIEDFIESDEGRRKLKDYMPGDALTLKGKSAVPGEYKLTSEASSRSWFIGYGLRSEEDMNARRRLAARASRDGLLNYSGSASPPYNGKLTQWVWMQILGE